VTKKRIEPSSGFRNNAGKPNSVEGVLAIRWSSLVKVRISLFGALIWRESSQSLEFLLRAKQLLRYDLTTTTMGRKFGERHSEGVMVRIMGHVKVLITATTIALGLLIAPLAQAASTKHTAAAKTTTTKSTAKTGTTKTGGSGKTPDLSGLAGLIGGMIAKFPHQ
jgi:preprotein translocase subunit SecG